MNAREPREIEGLKRVGAVVADCLAWLKTVTAPGMTTAEVDAMAAQFLAAHGARSAPILTYKFPGTTCISVNEDAAHGIPGGTVLAPGDLVNIDVSAELDGFFGDTGGSFVLPPGNPAHERLIAATEAALHRALGEVRAGARLNRIGWAIEQTAREHGFGVIRNLGSHGVGRALHEEPKFIAGYYRRLDLRRMTEGMVITIEPFLTTGQPEVTELDDGWTLRTVGGFTAQCEHTLVVTRDGPLLTTVPSGRPQAP